ncbi:MAG: AAA family ATPase [Oscillospiraceae bacterium]|nr:AAA family ATPase [Oscillospiraceae bacterium]
MAQRENNRRGGPYVPGALYEIAFIACNREDADTLTGLGFPAVAEWSAEDTELLRGKSVYILTGEEAAARALYGVADKVYMLEREESFTLTLQRCGLEDTVKIITQMYMDAPEWEPRHRVARTAAEFGEDDTRFLWEPYLPIGDYSVMMAEGGTGKTLLCCGIAASISNGKALPGGAEPGGGRSVLYISAEDSGEMLKKRLAASGADLERVFILDRGDSLGVNIAEGFDEFAGTVLSRRPALVIVDPWHAFIGGKVDISRANAVRPLFQKLSGLAKRCQCAMILISHVNKRAQGENANNAATGSTDLINASRSAFRVIFDEEDRAARIMVHTKSNYAPYGRSVRYKITGGGIAWDGFSEITRQTLEAAARRKSTPGAVAGQLRELKAARANLPLASALMKAAQGIQTPLRFTYEEFRSAHGEGIFGGESPKSALDGVREMLVEKGYYLKTGVSVRRGEQVCRGFLIQKITVV